jgi:hypothetical protein
MLESPIGADDLQAMEERATSEGWLSLKGENER